MSSSVVDAKNYGKPSFAHVVLKTEGGTITNEVGHFELNCLSDDTLVVSYLGYFPKVLVVSDIKNESKILLNPDTQLIEDVVVYADDDYLYEWLLQCRYKLKEQSKHILKSIFSGWNRLQQTACWILEAYYNNANLGVDGIRNLAFKTAGRIWLLIITAVIFLILTLATLFPSILCSMGRGLFFPKTRCSLERVRWKEIPTWAGTQPGYANNHSILSTQGRRWIV